MEQLLRLNFDIKVDSSFTMHKWVGGCQTAFQQASSRLVCWVCGVLAAAPLHFSACIGRSTSAVQCKAFCECSQPVSGNSLAIPTPTVTTFEGGSPRWFSC